MSERHPPGGVAAPDGRAVAVNLTWCLPGLVGGSEQYLVRQLLGLAEQPGGHEFAPVLYAAPGLAEAHPSLAASYPIVELPFSGRSRPARVAAEHSWLWWRSRRVALAHHGGGTVPAVGPSPRLLTVHDLQFLEFPEYFSRLKLEYLRRRMPRACRRAEVIAVPSAFVASTITDAYAIDPGRIVVVPHGIEPTIGVGRTSAEELRARYRLGDGPVLVLPAATFPHKGHHFLLDLLERHWTDPDLRLLFVGGEGAAEASIGDRIEQLGAGRRVIRAGRVGPADRDGLLALAAALVFPSEYEGFGAPLIEAMALGTPIIASDRAAVPEVLGDAGISRPLELDAWAGALDELTRRRDELVAAGRRRVAEFSNAASGRGAARRLPSGGAVKLVVLCPHFTPDTAPTGEVMTRIVGELAALGHELHVVTSLPWYRDHRIEPGWGGRLARRERTAWGSIVRVHPFPGVDKRSIARRAVGFAGFSVLAGLAGLVAGRSIRRADGVLAMSPPLTLGLTGWVVHLLRRGPLVFNIQDVFPDAAIETGAITDRRLIAAARWLERVSYRRAAAVTVLSDDLADNLRAKLPADDRHRVRVIPNFVDLVAITPMDRMTAYRAELGLGAEPVVMYAGNVGFSQSLELLLEAARRMPAVSFVVNGGGSARSELETAAAGLANVRFGDHQPRERISEVLATGDVHVVPLRRGLAAVSVPSKTYSILAAGRPILAAIDPDTEVPRLIERAGCGTSVPPEDPEAFCTALGGDARRGRPARRPRCRRTAVGRGLGLAGGGRSGLCGAVRRARQLNRAARETASCGARPVASNPRGKSIVHQEDRSDGSEGPRQEDPVPGRHAVPDRRRRRRRARSRPDLVLARLDQLRRTRAACLAAGPLAPRLRVLRLLADRGWERLPAEPHRRRRDLLRLSRHRRPLAR